MAIVKWRGGRIQNSMQLYTFKRLIHLHLLLCFFGFSRVPLILAFFCRTHKEKTFFKDYYELPIKVYYNVTAVLYGTRPVPPSTASGIFKDSQLGCPNTIKPQAKLDQHSSNMQCANFHFLILVGVMSQGVTKSVVLS